MSTHSQKAVIYLDLMGIEEIVEKYQFSIFKYCYQMVRSKETAEDITQEVFIKFYQLSRKKEYSGGCLYSIAYSKCIDYLRKEKRKHLLIKNYEDKTYEEPDNDLFSKNEYSDELEYALNALTGYERSVLLLKCAHELSYKEMSEILNKRESALRKQFQRAKSKVEKRLNEKGVTASNEEASII